MYMYTAVAILIVYYASLKMLDGIIKHNRAKGKKIGHKAKHKGKKHGAK